MRKARLREGDILQQVVQHLTSNGDILVRVVLGVVWVLWLTQDVAALLWDHHQQTNNLGEQAQTMPGNGI